jgi:hypothetical protein
MTVALWAASSSIRKSQPRLLISKRVLSFSEETILNQSVKALSYNDLSTLKRAEFEPVNVMESIIHPPPFSRSFFFLAGGLLLLTVGIATLSPSNYLAKKSASYHLPLGVLSIAYFSSEDYAHTRIARSQRWSHLKWPSFAFNIIFLSQLVVANYALNTKKLDRQYESLLGLILLHLATYNWVSLPLWLKAWRLSYLGVLTLSIPVVYICSQRETDSEKFS